jgi:serine/threonine protein kinase
MQDTAALRNKVQVTTVPGGLQALASRESQPNIMVVYVDKHTSEDENILSTLGDDDTIENIVRGLNLEEPVLKLSSSDDTNDNTDEDNESSENEENVLNLVDEQLRVNLQENSSTFKRGTDVGVTQAKNYRTNLQNIKTNGIGKHEEKIIPEQLKDISPKQLSIEHHNENGSIKIKTKKFNSKQKQGKKSNIKNVNSEKRVRRKRKVKGKSKRRPKRNQRPAVLTPEEFNDLYGLGDKIGSGAYGVVYRGLDKTNGAFLAVKEIYCGQDVVGGMTDVVSEVQILQRLRHPNIVRYVGAAILWDRLYIFTEWVSGGSLTQILAQFGQLPVGLVAQHTLQILKGLAYLHNQGIVHRDIKGQNILVSKDGRIKLADFGAARLLKNITKGPALFGTPAFLAPEVITNERCDIKADIWSLGCTIIQMLSGETPWAVRGFTSVYELLHHVSTSNDCPSLDHVPLRETTDDMVNFLNRCFCRDPDNRANTEELFSHQFVCSKQESKRQLQAEQCVVESNGSSGINKKILKSQDSFDDSFNRSGALKIATAFFRKAKGGNPTTPLQSPEKNIKFKTKSTKGNKKSTKKGWRLVPTSSEIHFRDAADRRVAYEKRSPITKEKTRKKIGATRDSNLIHSNESTGAFSGRRKLGTSTASKKRCIIF